MKRPPLAHILATTLALLVSTISPAWSSDSIKPDPALCDALPASKEVNLRVNNYFLTLYVRAREVYVLDRLAEDYNTVRLMTDPGIYRDFVNAVDPKNPQSPAAQFGRDGSRRIKIKSIFYPAPHTAQIHFSVKEKSSANAPEKQFDQLAEINFEYLKMNFTTDDDYLINPLGFWVSSYHVSDDASN